MLTHVYALLQLLPFIYRVYPPASKWGMEQSIVNIYNSLTLKI